MGYYANLKFENVFIRINNIKECLNAINELHTFEGMEQHEPSGGSWGGGVQQDRWYGFVHNPPEGGFQSLEDAFSAWRYEFDPELAEVIAFKGEKWSDDEVLFQAIAPYVINGARILCHGEDDYLWGYEFDDGVMYELKGEHHYTRT